MAFFVRKAKHFDWNACKKYIQTILKLLWQYFGMSDVLILTNVGEGMRAKLMRVAKGLRQIDVAAAARVDTIDITRLEKGRYVLPARQKRILGVLGLLDNDNESD